MELTRRGFLGGLVTAATMAEAGALAEIFDFLRRKPVSVLPPVKGWPIGTAPVACFGDPCGSGGAARLFLSSDGRHYEELKGIRSVSLSRPRVEWEDYDGIQSPVLLPPDEIEVRGCGNLAPVLLLFPDPTHFRLRLPDGQAFDGVIQMQTSNFVCDLRLPPHYQLIGRITDPNYWHPRLQVIPLRS
jgi:hypothetical protein